MSTDSATLHRPPSPGPVYFAFGLAFLALAKIKHTLRGYSTPKPFALTEPDRCIDYDVSIASGLLEHLEHDGGSIEGARVLELGPGSDLGVGLYLVAHGAASYTAFDRNPLAESVPNAFYERLAARARIPLRFDRVRYVARKDFDLAAALPRDSIDVVISNAAFEHFDDVDGTVRQLSSVVRSGGKIVAVIDLKTHSRWIRQRDPNNIYRYPRWLYRLFYFPGQPNRVRPAEYRAIFERHGWSNVSITPTHPLEVGGHAVHRDFRNCAFLDAGSIVLRATRR